VKAYRLGLEPRGDAYKDLLRAALSTSNSGFLVVRDTNELAVSGIAILNGLRPFIIEERRGSRWPGTVLLEADATIYRFYLNADSLGRLERSADGLYDWLQPDRPEDLGFLRPNNTPWLFTSAHEPEGFIVAPEHEIEWLRRELPE
jgi:hypothetical protein